MLQNKDLINSSEIAKEPMTCLSNTKWQKGHGVLNRLCLKSKDNSRYELPYIQDCHLKGQILRS